MQIVSVADFGGAADPTPFSPEIYHKMLEKLEI
jgi:hypothetical protein